MIFIKYEFNIRNSKLHIMSESKTNDCVICLENIAVNQMCSCGYCEYNACVNCTKKSILYQTSDPSCPNCNHAWSMEFCYKNFSNSWMTKTYRDHKKKLLFDIEKSKIPNTMPAVERIVKLENIEEKKKDIQIEIKALENQIWKARCELANCDRDSNKLRHSKVKKEEVYNFKCPKQDCGGFLNDKFICPMCSSQVCKKCFEIKEFDMQEGESKSNKLKYNHTCTESSIQSFKLIKKETKPCPNCSTRIFKVSGCDQMWCTQCHTTFSWITGLQVTGNIHNPHYYEWKKNNVETVDLRNVGEVLCGGIPNLNIISNISRNYRIYEIRLFTSQMTQNKFFRYKSNYFYKGVPAEIVYCTASNCFIPIFESKTLNIINTINVISGCTANRRPHFNKKLYNNLSEKKKTLYCSISRQKYFTDNLLKLHRALTHFGDYELHYLRIAVRDIDRKDEEMRIKYIMKKFNEKHYKMLIMKKNNKKQKLLKILHIFEMCNVTVLETFNDIIKCIVEIINEYNNHCDILFGIEIEREKEEYFQSTYLPWFKHNIDVKKVNIIKNYDRINNILNYCNKELWKVSKLFNQNVPFIHYGCIISEIDGVKHFDRPGYLQTISAKWDSNIFQLWERVSGRNIKLKGKYQEDYFNNCWLFNNTDNCVYYEGDRSSPSWDSLYEYQQIVTVKEVLDAETKNEYINIKKNRDIYSIIKSYGRGSSLFS